MLPEKDSKQTAGLPATALGQTFLEVLAVVLLVFVPCARRLPARRLAMRGV